MRVAEGRKGEGREGQEPAAGSWSMRVAEGRKGEGREGQGPAAGSWSVRVAEGRKGEGREGGRGTRCQYLLGDRCHSRWLRAGAIRGCLLGGRRRQLLLRLPGGADRVSRPRPQDTPTGPHGTRTDTADSTRASSCC